MSITYDAYSPADNGERIAQGEIELPDDAGDIAVLGALVDTVERDSDVEAGSQVRVVALRVGEEKPFVSHVWDHS